MIARHKKATLSEAIKLAIDFANHSHHVCVYKLSINSECYPKEELVKKDIDPNAGQRIVLQKDDRLDLLLYKVKVPGSGRKYFNYSIEPRDIQLTNASGRWPKEVAIALDVANLKFVITRLLELYFDATRKRYGSECRFATDGSIYDAELGGYPVVPGV
jgi:hypothetical protein